MKMEDNGCNGSSKKQRVVATEGDLTYHSDENGKINNASHETYKQHPSNYRSVSMGTDQEGNWMIGGNFYTDSASRAQKITQVVNSRLNGIYGTWEDSNV